MTENVQSLDNLPAPLPDSTGSNRCFLIHIEQLDYGYFVSVGCKKLAIEKKETLIEKLTQYITAPTETGEAFYKGELFK